MGILLNGEYTSTQEEWFPLTEFYIPNIQPWYMVSNYGKIYNKITGNIIPENYKEYQYNETAVALKKRKL